MGKPARKLWALLAAAIVGAAVCSSCGSEGGQSSTTAGDETEASHPTLADIPALIAAVRSDAAAGDFVGTWSGISVDKPEEGSSIDVFILEIPAPGDAAWTLRAQGSFPDPSPQDVTVTGVEGGMLTFTLGVRNGLVTVRLGVHAAGDVVLVGEATVLPGYDLADGAYLYLERCREDLPGC